jgi:hypothetical protein
MSPRAEIVTMNREGLAAFIRELKRTKIRHRHPELPKNKLDAAVELWEQQQRNIVVEMRTKPLQEGAIIDIRAICADEAEARFASVKFYLGGLNRDINEGRVQAYRADMEQGKWWFTPDPVVVTDTGEIINGQHRLLAVEPLANRPKDEDTSFVAPQFVVVWNVDKKAAILMDEARRTATDRRDIALRFAGAR